MVFKRRLRRRFDYPDTLDGHIAGVKLEARDRNGRLGFKPTVGTAIISFRFAYWACHLIDVSVSILQRDRSHDARRYIRAT